MNSEEILKLKIQCLTTSTLIALNEAQKIRKATGKAPASLIDYSINNIKKIEKINESNR